MAAPLFVAFLAGTVSAGDFQPFVQVPEFAPHPIKDFCGQKDAKTGLAKCQRAFRTMTDDASDVALSWEMHVDPDSILSVDTEGGRGVRLAGCGPDDLELVLPEDYVRHAREGTLIVASRFAHLCEHEKGKHMFRKVLQVKKLDWSGLHGARVARAHVLTKRFQHVTEAVPFLSFNFSYMPAEARDIVEYPVRRTRHHVRPRRLDDFDAETHYGNPQQSSQASGGVDTQNSLVDFNPNQLANFGWNWNFFLNSSEEPEFNYSLPGIQGYVKLKQPYIKIHAGIFLNLSSHFGDLLAMKTPHVVWKAGIKGHGVINARMMTDMKATDAASEDPFSLFDIPALEKLSQITWLEKIDVSMGAFPFTVEPGFQFKAELYHTGDFDGTLQLGGKTHCEFQPQVSFDSHTGLTVQMQANFRDTTLYPPLWIISTKHFEMGLMLEPTIWVKGQFGAREDARVGFEARPYLNVTISRETDTVVGDETKTLIAYPFRVIGLGSVHFSKRYKVTVTANGQSMSSTPELNWGQVEIHDHMGTFDVGQVDQKTVLTKAIKVELFEVDSSGASKAIGDAEVKCGSLLNGECQPNPVTAKMTVEGKPVRVELAVLWQDNPVPWFASRIRGVTLGFPSLIVNQDALEDAIPELAAGTAPTQKLFLRATHASRTYVTEVSGLSSYTGGTGTLKGSSVIEFGPTFLESWIPCGESNCESGKLELFYGAKLIGSAKMPEIPWNSIPDIVTDENDAELAARPAFTHAPNLGDLLQAPSDSQAGVQGGMQTMLMGAMQSMLSAGVKPPQEIPLTVSLSAVKSDSGSSSPNLAVIHVMATVVDPAGACSFLKPSKPEEVAQSDTRSFMWTISNPVEGSNYNFRLSSWKVLSTTPTDMAAYASYPSVGDTTLQPIAGGTSEVAASCTRTPIEGMSSDDAPCSFSHLFVFDPTKYAVNDRVVLMVEWIQDGTDHVLYSPPFVIKAAGSRRLQEARPRRLWTQEDWDARLAANEASCKDSDLHFEIGFGAMARARMVDDDMPNSLKLMMGRANSLMSTGFQRLGQADMVNSDFDHLLPDWLCEDGVCKGKMPGCAQANFKTKYFPTLVLNFNREFKYDDLPDDLPVGPEVVKMAVAYAFSTMPELIEVLLAELNGTNPTTTMMSQYPVATPPSLQWPVSGVPGTTVAPLYNPYAVPGTIVPPVGAILPPTTVGASIPLAAFTTSAAPGAPTILPNAGANYDAVPRRLRFEPTQGRARRSRTYHRSVKVTFKGGVHYIIDRPLVEMMMRHGMFQEIEDDDTKRGKGPLFITDFQIYSDSEGKVGALDDSPSRAMERPWFMKYAGPKALSRRGAYGVVALAVVVALAAVASMVVMRSKSRLVHYEPAQADNGTPPLE